MSEKGIYLRSVEGAGEPGPSPFSTTVQLRIFLPRVFAALNGLTTVIYNLCATPKTCNDGHLLTECSIRRKEERKKQIKIKTKVGKKFLRN